MNEPIYRQAILLIHGIGEQLAELISDGRR
jgi:hypothetical protein